MMLYMFQAVSASVSDKLVRLDVSSNILFHITGRLLKKLCKKKHDQSNSSTHNRSQNNNMIDQSPSYIFWTQHGCLHWSWAAERSAEDPWKWQGLYNYTQTHAQTTQILQMTWAHYPVIGQSCLTMKTNDHFILKYLLVDLPNRHLWAPSSAMHLSVFDHDVPGVLPFRKHGHKM